MQSLLTGVSVWDDPAVETRRLGDGQIKVSWTGVAGRPGLVPRLVLQGTVLASDYGAGAIAQVSVEATLAWETGGYSFLGNFGSKSVLLRWPPPLYVPPNPPPADEMSTVIELSLSLPLGTIEGLEQARQGAGFSLLFDSSVVLIDGGEPTDSRTGDYYTSLSVRDGQDILKIAPHDWGAILEVWGRGTGITVLVPIGGAEHSQVRVEIVEHLRVARVKIDGADYTGSIAGARKALEMLRGLLSHVKPLPPVKRTGSAAEDLCGY